MRCHSGKVVTAIFASLGSAHQVQAFQQPRKSAAEATTTSTCLHSRVSKSSLPKYDKATKRWVSTSDTDCDEGYDALGTLLRFGPVPYIKRLTQPDVVEQAVLKYQVREGCSRTEAQANMDAYFENPNDWFQQKLEEKRGLPKRDYTYIDKTEILFSLVWAVVVTSVLGTMANEVISGSYCINYPDARFCEVFPR
mmetsp:Transcript_15359/g.33400  ORF Transcript_15359/g.33400 Transcript_15359/m.33400 type:complete len:195 (-) Transcript_15359:281-865(-)|eukprot:CAMPEP_0178498060 /NCGR_PEP_ID=MMETSP0696-20121128/15039_1 /TAXON_ID=265572 /ORGANISM="Extubocellulus spinifer, Strain CCMP396" /LENGTH=194 /DNA_ID=CAMNT_0020126565 /DNA_START=155 /DNA_END=739 /DNA_ORIENTATION=-